MPCSTTAPFLIAVQETASAKFTLGVQDTPGAKFTLSIVPDIISPPRNVLAAHIGSGNVLVVFDEPLTGNINYYDVFISDEISGNYIRWGRSIFYHSPVMMNNIPVGVTGFIRVRAVSNGGEVSDWTQAMRGSTLYPSVTMRCSAPSGSIIDAGSIFTVQSKDKDRLLAFRAQNEIVFTD